jgi:2-polyprenyl-6-methoxyphenol hydroxylase-like FAD-dependent oxidoreductase
MMWKKMKADAGVPAEVPVLIVGAGSVGLALAAELGWRGIDCAIVERSSGLNPHPRANAVANRTMEYFRRWGIDKRVTESGIGPDLPARYLWVSSLNGRELHRIELPGHKQLLQGHQPGGDARAPQNWSAYLKTTTGQNHVEQAMLDFVQAQPGVSTHFNCELRSFQQDASAVETEIIDRDSGKTSRIKSRYLVACDGGRSTVRETLGIALSGRAAIARFVSIYFRAAELPEKCRFGHANIYFPLHRDYRGFILNWDGGAEFTYHLILADNVSPDDIDPVAAIHAVLGHPIQIDVIGVQPWTAHALVADRYRDGRVFLCGDAAHLFTPTGGFGMNTGVSDAIDLAWKLKACLSGWGGNNLLDSYEMERRPIGLRNTAEAADCFDQLYATMQFGDELDDDGPTGETLRAELGVELKKQEKLIASAGTLLGYRYNNSPLVVDDGSPETPDDAGIYEPTARPGHRAPHYWLAEGVTLYDRLGADFTLLQFDGGCDVGPLLNAAHELGMPLSHLLLPSVALQELYQCRLAIVRPDLMMAWRADEPPDDVPGLLNTLRGAATQNEV